MNPRNRQRIHARRAASALGVLILGVPMLPGVTAEEVCVANATQDDGPGAGAPGERIERRLLAMGTWLRIDLEAGNRPLGLGASESAVLALRAVEMRLSTWSGASELAQLNRLPLGATMRLSEALAKDLRCAQSWCARTQGAFDPGVGALVEAWDLRGGGRRPHPTEVERALASGGIRSLDLEGRIARRTHGGLRLEEGGLGKGIGLDAALAALADAGVDRGLLDLGGQVAVLESARAYGIEIADPRQRKRPVARLRIHSGSVATSGNSERGIEVDGERLGHLLDPRTGHPAPDFGSITVWAPDATTADVLSTALYVLGPEAGLAWCQAHPPVQALVLRTGAEGRLEALCSEGLAARVELLDPTLSLHTHP